MSANNRRSQPGTLSTETVLLLTGLLGAALAIGVVNGAVRVAHMFEGGRALPADPFKLVFGLIAGDTAWTTATTVIAVVLVVIAGALIVTAWMFLTRAQGKRSRVDPAARYMGRGRDVETVSRRHAATTAERLGVDQANVPGLTIGKTIATGEELFSTFEDQRVTVAGPRVGKTTSLVIPEIMEAPGAVLTTSNKRDVVDATRTARQAVGQCWVFDPQSIVDEEPNWWWNPLTYVRDEVTADKLARHFSSAKTGGKTDAHFEENAQALLSGLILAAALDGRPITAVWEWVTRPADRAAVDVLMAHDYPLTADELNGIQSTPDKERGSIYSTARRMARCLTSKAVLHWITPQEEVDARPHFSPETFVRDGRQTLYSLSKEGAGSAGPLVTALTVAVYEAAQDYAREQGGRLRVPVVCSLDEAANVCRWGQLPDEYSHAGSRGILFNTVLQSYAQGVDVWGKEGMEKLWTAANVAMYLGGVRQKEFLEDLSVLIGDYDKVQRSVSTGRGQRSVSEHTQRERIMAVDELASLPKGRAVVLASGARATLVRTVPWMAKPYADEVRGSITIRDPEADRTLAEAERELASVTEREVAQAGGRDE